MYFWGQLTGFLLVCTSFYPLFDPPISGVQKCEDWGPGGIFKVCCIECNKGWKFSQEFPEFYVRTPKAPQT